HLANSGLCGRGQEVRSILHAIALVGLRRISHVVITAALWRGIPNRRSPFIKTWWRHSVATALLAEHASKDLAIDFGYTAGLLHGIGQLALFEHAGETYAQFIEDAVSHEVNLLQAERAAHGVDHAELAGKILEVWGLPEALREAVAHHHDLHAGSEVSFAVQ